MKIKKLTELSLLTASALIIFIVEMRFPDIIPVQGVKPGLANIITVYAVYKYAPSEAALVLLARILLGSVFTGNISALLYSFSGAVLCLAGMIVFSRIIPIEYLWLCSIIGAILHNTGQILAAAAIMKTPTVFAYYPILLTAGCIAGAFTGICAQLIIKKIGKKKGE